MNGSLGAGYEYLQRFLRAAVKADLDARDVMDCSSLSWFKKMLRRYRFNDRERRDESLRKLALTQ